MKKNNGYIQRSIIELLKKETLTEPEILRKLGMIRTQWHKIERAQLIEPSNELTPILKERRPSRWCRIALRILVTRGVVVRHTLSKECITLSSARCQFTYSVPNI